MQEKINALEKTAQKVGLKISQEKTKAMRTDNNQQEPLTISGTEIEDVNDFTYLGSKISNKGGTDEDINTRIKKARQAFAMLKPVWRATTISTNTKFRIYSSNHKILSYDLYKSYQAINSASHEMYEIYIIPLKKVAGKKFLLNFASALDSFVQAFIYLNLNYLL